MKTIDLLMDELRSMESEHQLRYESLCRLLNYWYPILGYDSANEMSYPAWGDSRARPAPYIAQLESALVEERANSIYTVAPHEMEYCIVLAREQLEELGLLTKLQNGES